MKNYKFLINTKKIIKKNSIQVKKIMILIFISGGKITTITTLQVDITSYYLEKQEGS